MVDTEIREEAGTDGNDLKGRTRVFPSIERKPTLLVDMSSRNTAQSEAPLLHILLSCPSRAP